MQVDGPGWPDSRSDEPPRHDAHRQGAWLIGRHPRLALLLDRVQGVVRVVDGRRTVDLDSLASVYVGVTAYQQAMVDYYNSGPDGTTEPPDPDDYAPAAPGGELPMSYGEAASLQLLAMLAPTVRIPFKVSDLEPLDREGRAILADWCRLLPVE